MIALWIAFWVGVIAHRYHRWAIYETGKLLYRATTRCKFCNRNLLRCWDKNVCEGFDAMLKRREALARTRAEKFLGAIGLRVVPQTMTTPDFSGDLKPPTP